MAVSEPEGLPAPRRRAGNTAAEGWGVLEQAGEMTRRGQAFALATVVWRQGPSSGQQGSRAIITASGELHGWIGGACAEPAVIREARQVIAEGRPRLLLLGSTDWFGAASRGDPGHGVRGLPGKAECPPGPALPEGVSVVPISCQSEGALEVYIEPVLPAPHLVIVGRSPMAHTLADLARALGWRAALIDGPDFSAADADERSMVVVATQGHGDEEAVAEAVAARPAYLGMVGSRRRGAAVLGYLADRGVPAGQLDRVRVPAGLDLGKTTHREIAVAILAELVQLRASGALGSGAPADSTASGSATSAGRRQPAAGHSTANQGPTNQGPTNQGAEAVDLVDPVCGMTVTADASSRPLEHEGVAYYFCSAGCRSVFEKDPEAYRKRETRC
jgi:xanthine dehydrogenase accessory factor